MPNENPEVEQKQPAPRRRPLVAIVGRQNVGKSTLLNRLAGRRIAIVEDLPGTTRDRLTANVSWLDKEFTVIDLSLIHISEPTRRTPISYAVFCLKKKKK